jgi:hypothetical protein
MPACARSFLLAALTCAPAFAGWGTAPKDWGDFRFALVDDNTRAEVIGAALKANTKIYGRYRYLNGGADPASNWYNYSGPDGATLTNFDKNSAALGIRSSYVIYMLQEEGGASGFYANVGNTGFMKNFFKSLELAAGLMKDQGTVYVIEPDTWGYLLQDEHSKGVAKTADFGKSTAAKPAAVNNLGIAYLSDLPNTVAGMIQGMFRVLRHADPTCLFGLHAVTWAWYPATGGDVRGMVYWKQADVDIYADIMSAFLLNLVGQGERGNFLTVEKYGLDAGVGGDRYYWNDENMAKWVGWSKRVAQKLDLPLIGWQIPIGHMGLPNTPNRYEDTFMAYFFAHPKDFIDAGFIGLWVGKGLGNGTDYSVKANEGDGGWLFQNMRTFDAQRPYLTSTAVRLARAGAVPRLDVLNRRGGQMIFRQAHTGLDYTALGRPAAASRPVKGISK